MSTAAMWPTDDVRLVPRGDSADTVDEAGSQNKIKALRQLAVKLLREVQSLNEVQTLDVQEGLNFYQEVTRFEVDLIKRALAITGGHQGRAARLLNLKVTTLNSKIKHYDIDLTVYLKGYPYLEQLEGEASV
jgi:transcriptional regulator with GAF, ATPase, and Fis domain